jgi:hypothetical protein
VRVRVTDGGGAGASSVSQAIPIRVEPLPIIQSAEFLDDTLPQQLRLTFNKPVGSLAASDVVVRNLTTGQNVVGATLVYDDATRRAALTFGSRLADGRYTASIASAAVTDRFSVGLDGNGDGIAGGDFTFNFVHLTADFNHDARVDHLDFNTLYANFGRADAGFAGGDLNYDGVVDFKDFQALELNFGKSLPAPAEPQGALAGVETEASRQVRPSPRPPAPRPMKVRQRS